MFGTRSTLPSAYGSHVAITAILSTVSCTLVLNREEGQCETHSDCQQLSSGYVCGEGGVCVALVVDQPLVQDPQGAECRQDADCMGEESTLMCRTGYCRDLQNASAGCVVLMGPGPARGDSEAMLLGVLVSGDELGGPELPRGVSGAVHTALTEIERHRSGLGDDRVPSVIAVACDEANPGAIEYLIDDLQVQLIIGPTRTDLVEYAMQRVAEKALLVLPFADGPDLEPRMNDPRAMALGCRPNRKAVWPYFLDVVTEARRWFISTGDPAAAALNPALLVRDDAATMSFADGLGDDALGKAGIRRVLFSAAAGPAGLSVALGGAEPPVDLVIAASGEGDWVANMAMYDAAFFGSKGSYPYYLLSDKRAASHQPTRWNSASAQPEESQHLRLLGIDYRRSDRSVLAREAFSSAFFAQTRSVPEVGQEYAYDCTYVAVYAAVAAGLRLRRPVSSLPTNAIITGLRALQGGETPLAVGATDLPAIIAGLTARQGMDGALDLFGATGELDFELPNADAMSGLPVYDRQYFSVSPTDSELYCIDARTRAVCDMGIIFSVLGGPPSRLENPCTCLRAP